MRQVHILAVITFLFFGQSLDHKHESYRGLASSWTMIPSRSLAGLHYIFKGYDSIPEKGLVRVSGPVIEITTGEQGGSKIYPFGYSLEMDEEDFEEEQALALSIFQARSGNGMNVGTAFLVGKNLVLTNRHVLSVPRSSKKWACGQFSILLNHLEKRIACRKVRYCSSRFDYCIVELTVSVNDLKPLRLARVSKSDRDISLLHIGNVGGLGLQASRGRGLRIEGGEFHHFAPTLYGSSGAPIFDEKGRVIGINWAHTGKDFVDEASFNRGILIETIYKELKATHPYTLNEIRSFRSWYQREKEHRVVELKSESGGKVSSSR
jgi:hypothetical protein